VLGSLAASLVVLAMVGAAPAGRGGHRAERETLRRTQQLLDRLQQKDTEAIAATLHPEVTFTHPLSLSGKREDAVRRQGKDEVLGYLGGAFTLMDRIRFTNQRVSVAGGGGTAFAQADGDLTTADGRPYQNVYLFRIDWSSDRIIAIEEYANPLTFCQTFNNPLCAGRPANGDQRTPGG
jgi:ketosteroid isomerase-like protein